MDEKIKSFYTDQSTEEYINVIQSKNIVFLGNIY